MSGTAPQSLAQTYGLRSGRVLPQHSHSESHWALVSDSRCESEAAIAIPQLIINQRPETDNHWELPQSAKGALEAAIRTSTYRPLVRIPLSRRFWVRRCGLRVMRIKCALLLQEASSEARPRPYGT